VTRRAFVYMFTGWHASREVDHREKPCLMFYLVVITADILEEDQERTLKISD